MERDRLFLYAGLLTVANIALVVSSFGGLFTTHSGPERGLVVGAPLLLHGIWIWVTTRLAGSPDHRLPSPEAVVGITFATIAYAYFLTQADTALGILTLQIVFTGGCSAATHSVRAPSPPSLPGASEDSGGGSDADVRRDVRDAPWRHLGRREVIAAHVLAAVAPLLMLGVHLQDCDPSEAWGCLGHSVALIVATFCTAILTVLAIVYLGTRGRHSNLVVASLLAWPLLLGYIWLTAPFR